jgi:uncharacterized protein YbbK (DUF523 family)
MKDDDRAGSSDDIYLVSPCILGIPTRWDGNHCLAQELVTLAAEGRVLPFCAEVTGGLTIPRGDASIQACDGETVLFRQGSTADGHDVLDGNAKVVTSDGVDVTDEYVRGAGIGLALVKKYGIKTAILKAYSPSCGSQRIYDGTFTLTLKPGQGVLAALLTRHGVTVYSENNLKDLLVARP